MKVYVIIREIRSGYNESEGEKYFESRVYKVVDNKEKAINIINKENKENESYFYITKYYYNECEVE